MNKLNRTCMGLCKKYIAKKPTSGGRYENGQLRCQICEIYITLSGTKNDEGISCKCCNYRVRGSPRNKVYKEKFRETSILIETKTCPACGIISKNSQELEKLFGFRKMKNGNIYPQSHCRDCRNKEPSKKLMIKPQNISDEDLNKIQKLKEFFSSDQKNDREIMNLMTMLYEKYHTISLVSEMTGLSPKIIKKYVKFVRLPKLLKDEFEQGKITLDIGLRATDVLNWDGDKNEEKKVLDLSHLMQKSTSAEKNLIEKIILSDPHIKLSYAMKIVSENT